MKKDFLNYIKTTFDFDADEMKAFEASLSTPLKKSIRVNTNKISIEDFKMRAEKNGWILSPTAYGKNTFYIDRDTDLSLPLGNTLEHLGGFFYIQELAASSAPFFLSEDKKDEWIYTILDMSASPWGKTTSLSEYYPNSFIIANELDKSRLKTLFENTDRMGSKNVFITNYDGRFFKNFENFFDKILLDAPCSGEGTAFKTEDALKYRNIKNVKTIARLQYKLLESALISLKIWGELIYSTCTLNTIENEGVIEKLRENYPDSFEIIPLWSDFTFKRNWPHRDKTWGFFVAKIIKKRGILDEKEKKQIFLKQNIEKLPQSTQKQIETFLQDSFWYSLEEKELFRYQENIYMAEKWSAHIWETLFLYKAWIQIGTIKNNEFEPSFFFGTLCKHKKGNFILEKNIFDTLMQGYEQENLWEDGYFQVIVDNTPAGIFKRKNNKWKLLLPQKFVRK